MKELFRKYRTDLLLTGAIVVIALILLGIFSTVKKPGGYAEINVSGRIFFRMDLSERDEFKVELPDGSYNLIRVEAGQVFCEEANCPDKLCVKQGRKSLIGETIVCLPHQMTVTIRESEEEAEE